MRTKVGKRRQNISKLIESFHEDCNLRGMACTMDYIYRVKEFCDFLEAQGKSPLNVSRDDLKAFLGHLKERDLKVRTLNRLFSCLSSFYEFLMAEELVEYNPILPFRKY